MLHGLVWQWQSLWLKRVNRYSKIHSLSLSFIHANKERRSGESLTPRHPAAVSGYTRVVYFCLFLITLMWFYGKISCFFRCKTKQKVWDFNRAVALLVFASWRQVRIKKLPHQPLKIALQTHHTSASVNCQPMRSCAKLSILSFLLAPDGCHSNNETRVTNSPEPLSAAFSHTSSVMSSLDEKLRQWSQWSRGIKTRSVVVTFYDSWQGSRPTCWDNQRDKDIPEWSTL